MFKWVNRIKFIFKVKKFAPFLLEFFQSKQVPLKHKALSVLFIIIYFIVPFDLIPDFFYLFGIFDDVSVLLFILQRIIKIAPIELKEKYGLLIKQDRN